MHRITCGHVMLKGLFQDHFLKTLPQKATLCGIYGNCFPMFTVRLTFYLLNILKVSIDDKLIKTLKINVRKLRPLDQV